MALRTRLSLAFVLIVLVPILVGAIAVLIAVPHILKSQIGTRLRTAGVSVTDVLSARCTQAQQAAQLLGLEVATHRPAGRGDQDGQRACGRLRGGVRVERRDCRERWSTCQRPRAGRATSTLNSCGDAKNANVAISSRARPGDRRESAAEPGRGRVVGRSDDGGQAAFGALGFDRGNAHDRRRAGVQHPYGHPSRGADRCRESTRSRDEHHARRCSTSRAASWRSCRRPRTSPTASSSASRCQTRQASPRCWPAIVVVTILAGLVMGRLLARLISGPVVELSEAAARAASGDLDIAIPVRSKDEVGQLATAFNHMTSELQTYIRQLESSRDELRQNLDRLGATLTHTHDLDGILAVVLDTAIGSAQATGGAIMFLDADGNLTVQVRRGRGRRERRRRHRRPARQGHLGNGRHHRRTGVRAGRRRTGTSTSAQRAGRRVSDRRPAEAVRPDRGRAELVRQGRRARVHRARPRHDPRVQHAGRRGDRQRAAASRGATPEPHRSADRPVELPLPDDRPGPRNRARNPIQSTARGADARPRPVQVHQRQVRASGRRRGADRVGRPDARRGSRGRHRLALRRRGVRDRASGDGRDRRSASCCSSRHRHQIDPVLPRPCPGRSRGRPARGSRRHRVDRRCGIPRARHDAGTVAAQRRRRFVRRQGRGPRRLALCTGHGGRGHGPATPSSRRPGYRYCAT